MTSTEQMNNVLDQVKIVTSKQVTAYLENKERWGEFTFRNVETEIRALYSLLEGISNLPLTYLPRPYNEYYSNPHGTQSAIGTKDAKDFYPKTSEICSLFSRIESFSVSNAGEQGLVGITDDVKNRFDEIYNFYSYILPMLSLLGKSENFTLSEMNKQAEKANEICNELTGYASEKKQEVESLLTVAREITLDQGVSKHTQDFSQEVARLAKIGRGWLWATGVLASLSLVMAIVSLFLVFLIDMKETAQVIQYSVSKIVTLGLLFGSTIWCGKNYRAIKHQESVNQNRKNALSTFRAFVEATDDPTTKEAVLLETTRSIFAPSASGYLSNTDSVNADNLKIVEMVKRISGQDSN